MWAVYNILASPSLTCARGKMAAISEKEGQTREKALFTNYEPVSCLYAE